VSATEGPTTIYSNTRPYTLPQSAIPAVEITNYETSFEAIIQETLSNLEGSTGTPETYAILAADVLPAATQLTLNNAVYSDGSGIGIGVIEIDSELISVLGVISTNAETGVAVVGPVIRGFRGSRAVAHAEGAIVRINPRLTKMQVSRAINDTITSLHPRIPVVRSYEFTYTGNRTRYPLPSDALNVLQVSYSVPGSTGDWMPSRRWAFDATATSLDGASRMIDVKDALSSRKVQVVYQASVNKLVNANDDFASTTGLPEWTRDIVVYGALYRLAANLDGQKITSLTAEQSMMNQRGAYGAAAATSGTQLSRYYFSLYQARLAEAEARIQDTYPATRHYIR
jgi:hypothetical protein